MNWTRDDLRTAKDLVGALRQARSDEDAKAAVERTLGNRTTRDTAHRLLATEALLERAIGVAIHDHALDPIEVILAADLFCAAMFDWAAQGCIVVQDSKGVVWVA